MLIIENRKIEFKKTNRGDEPIEGILIQRIHYPNGEEVYQQGIFYSIEVKMGGGEWNYKFYKENHKEMKHLIFSWLYI